MGGDGVITRSDADGFSVDRVELHGTIQDAQNLVEFRIDNPTVFVVKKTKSIVDSPGNVVISDVIYVVSAVNINEAKQAITGE